MKKRILVYTLAGMVVLGGAVGMSFLTAHASPVNIAAATAPQPTYTSNIQVANPQDKSADWTEAGKTAEGAGDQTASEAAEAASLQAMAKVSPEQAKAAALAAVPGTAIQVSLDNENGNVV